MNRAKLQEKSRIHPSEEQKTEKNDTHYGFSKCMPNVKEFLDKYPQNTDYNKGFLLHLVTDFLFYKAYLKIWSKDIYNDYDVINKKIIEKYNLEIPVAVKDIVKFKEGKTKILSLEDAIKFIQKFKNINLEEFLKSYNNSEN